MQAEELAVGRYRQLRFDMQVARGIVAGEGLAAFAGPFDRPADLLRRPRDQHELGIQEIAGAEVAAGLPGDDADLLGLEAEDDRELLLRPHHRAAAGIERIAAGRRIVGAQRGARLHRHAGDPLDVGLDPHDIFGLGKAGAGRLRIADPGIDGDVVHRRQGLVDDPDRFGGVLGLRHGLGDDERHALADEADAVGRQDHRPLEQVRRAVEIVEPDVGRAHRLRDVRDGLQPLGQHVGAGQDQQHAGHLQRGRGVDRHDAGVRVRRAQHEAAGLVGQGEVVRVAAAAGQQPRILEPRQ